MAFCSNCGQELVGAAKFCANCGASNNSHNQPHSTYEGTIHKCPCCNEVLNSFSSNCPACGYEIRNVNATNSVKELCERLEEIEKSRTSNNSSFFKNIFNVNGTLSETDERKINLIKNYSIPNTKEDIYEFMILAASNIDFKLYGGLNSAKDETKKAICDAWMAKFEQAHEKAKLIFNTNSNFYYIDNIYNNVFKKIKKAKRNTIFQVISPYIFILTIFALIFIVLAICAPGDAKNETVRLEAIVVEVETALSNKEYELAMLNAKSIDYDGSITNDELERKWDIKREHLIQTIIEKAANDGITIPYPDKTADEKYQITVEYHSDDGFDNELSNDISQRYEEQ